MKTKSAEEVNSLLKALFIKEGPPTIIQPDNGGEFIGEVVQKLCQEFKVGIIHEATPPLSQGQIENLNKAGEEVAGKIFTTVAQRSSS